MRQVTDMMGRRVLLAGIPKRIVSVVPSQTELLYDLGLDEEVVGITKFCVHPDSWFRNKQRIGGTKNLNLSKILALRPDLILANKEENTKEQIEALAAAVPVWISDIHHLDDALQMIQAVGILVDKQTKANELATEINQAFAGLARTGPARRVAYFIWRNPWMVAGGDTFIHDMIQRAGWENVFSAVPRYPAIALDDLKQHSPDTILLSSEPYPFRDSHIGEIHSILPDATVMLVDGEMFSWYGSRLMRAASYFSGLAVKIR